MVTFRVWISDRGRALKRLGNLTIKEGNHGLRYTNRDNEYLLGNKIIVDLLLARPARDGFAPTVIKRTHLSVEIIPFVSVWMSRHLSEAFTNRKTTKTSIILPLCTSSGTDTEETEDEREFDYLHGSKKGPKYWGKINPHWQACERGDMQSPIDILNSEVHEMPALGKLRRDYKPAQASVKNRGHDIMVKWRGGAGTITINETEYILKQCHWHSPSEHTFNGSRHQLELHMVHESHQGKTAVVGITYKYGTPDPFLAKIIPSIGSVGEEEKDLGIINPGNVKFGSRKYYRYVGSLTVPPCTEGVIWTIIKKQFVEMLARHLLACQSAALLQFLSSQPSYPSVGLQVLSGVKPNEKKQFVSELQKKKNVVAMVGDGINDAAALASTDVGVAMGGGVGAASEVSSVVLMGNRLSQAFEMVQTVDNKEGKRFKGHNGSIMCRWVRSRNNKININNSLQQAPNHVRVILLLQQHLKIQLVQPPQAIQSQTRALADEKFSPKLSSTPRRPWKAARALKRRSLASGGGGP
ncbi:hypothetical protein Syun_017631 [Stephania yunnanensis]|uniref:Alpha-carbonic anhydrase domain-containing protein n=1 Tax=Stephania yunnanensis TaxID=152371 RepID=A0AAP0J799_9MAGN